MNQRSNVDESCVLPGLPAPGPLGPGLPAPGPLGPGRGRLTAAVVVVVAVVAAVGAPRAEACECNGGRADLVAPTNLASVLVDARVMVFVDGAGAETASVRLLGPDGASIDVEATTFVGEGRTLHVLTPRASLAANAEHRVGVAAEPYFIEGPLGPHADGTFGVVFTTSADLGPTPAVPALPTVTIGEPFAHWGGAGFCPASRRFLFPIHIEAGDGVVLVDRASRATVDEVAVAGVVQTLFLPGAEFQFLGKGDCGGTWLDAFFNASDAFRFGTLSSTGVFSGWTPAITLTLPGDRDCDGASDSVDGCPDEPGRIDPTEVFVGSGCPAQGAPRETWCEVALDEGEGEGEASDGEGGEGEGEPNTPPGAAPPGCAFSSSSPADAIVALPLVSAFAFVRRRRASIRRA